jgi:hypothetical protein
MRPITISGGQVDAMVPPGLNTRSIGCRDVGAGANMAIWLSTTSNSLSSTAFLDIAFVKSTPPLRAWRSRARS